MATPLPKSSNSPTNNPSTEIENKDAQNETLHKAPSNDTSRLEEIAKDWKYAKLSTWMMYLATAFSCFNPNKAPSRAFENDNPDRSAKAGLIGRMQDFFLRLRMMGQMTLHADPGNQKLIGDDVAMSNLHNITAQKFGMSAYKFHAFWSIPSWIIQNFIFTGKHPLSVIPNMLCRSFDRIMRLSTNLFWNLRRITLGLIPYINNDLINMCSPDSHAYKKLREASAPVRAVMEHWSLLLLASTHKLLNKYMPRPIMNFIESKLNFNFSKLRDTYRTISTKPDGDINPIVQLWKVARENIANNWNALRNGKHKSILTGELQNLRVEEPNTPTWYLKSKLLASLLNPIIGLGSALINSGSMVTGVLGEFVRNKNTGLLSISQNLMDSANGAMSVVYMLGEVLGHAATVQRNYKNGEIKLANMSTFGIGLFGMGWRIVKGLFSALAIPGMVIKPLGNLCKKVLHSRIDNFLEPLFLLFWSVNRDVNLRNSYNAEASTAGYAERKAAEKHNRITEVLTLPAKILTRDKQVTYDHPEALALAAKLASN